MAGWLIAFPFTSAPVSLFLAIDHGERFAADAARGSIATVVGECVFALAFARIQGGWPAALVSASAAYLAAAGVMRFVALDTIPLAALMVVVILVALRLAPQAGARVDTGRTIPAWDLPARIVVTTGLVVGITLFAPTLGAYASAVLASFPLYASILGVFEERTLGHAAAVDVMRGLIPGLLGFTAFFLVVALALEQLGIVVAYAAAVAAVLAVQGIVLAVVRR